MCKADWLAERWKSGGKVGGAGEKSGKVGRKVARKCPIIWPALLVFFGDFTNFHGFQKQNLKKEVFQTNAENCTADSM